MLAAVWASPFLIDGKIFLGDEDGDVVVMAHSKEKIVIGEMNMGSAVYGTIVPANGSSVSTTAASCSRFRRPSNHAAGVGTAHRALAGSGTRCARASPRERAGGHMAAVPRHRQPHGCLGEPHLPR